MSILPQIGRRAFLGAGAAVVAGTGLVAALTARGRGHAHFAQTDAYPDAEVDVAVELPGVRDGALGAATLFVVTPREALSIDLGAVTFHNGRGTVAATLAYPYDARVAGDYRFHVRVELDGRRVVTAQPAGYSVRQIRWFS